jgi:hypothetical protein
MLVTGLDVNGQHSPLDAQLQATLNIIPAYAWYAAPSGALAFVNEQAPTIWVSQKMTLSDPARLPARIGTATSLSCTRMIARKHAGSSRPVCGRVRRGKEPGHEIEDWLQAERELMGINSR